MVCSNFTGGKVSSLGFGTIFTSFELLNTNGLVCCQIPMRFGDLREH